MAAARGRRAAPARRDRRGAQPATAGSTCWRRTPGSSSRARTRSTTLLAAGLPDRRLPTLPGAYDALLAQLDDVDPRLPGADAIADLCDRLAAFGIRETVQHDDLHDGQVFLGAGVHQVLDWGDACVSHPFFTLAVTLEGVIAWGLDDVEDSEDLRPHLAAYLGPYAAHYGTTVAHLREAAAIAMRLGWVCRAVNGALPQDPGQTHTRLKMFLDGKP